MHRGQAGDVDGSRAARATAAYLLVARTMLRRGSIDDLLHDVALARGRGVELLAADVPVRAMPGGVVVGTDRDYLLYPRSADLQDVMPAVSHALAHLLLGHAASPTAAAPATRRLVAHPFVGAAERDATRLSRTICRLDRTSAWHRPSTLDLVS